jgi:glyoxylate carboligase
LEKEGVRYVFGVPGEEIEDLLFALAASSIAFVPCRHEQGAAFIADVCCGCIKNDSEIEAEMRSNSYLHRIRG